MITSSRRARPGKPRGSRGDGHSLWRSPHPLPTARRVPVLCWQASDLMLGPRLILDGFWEAWVTLAIGRHIQPGFHCVDVGANYGYYSLVMAAAAGATGRVFGGLGNRIRFSLRTTSPEERQL